MVKNSMFKREDGALLVIWETPKGNLIGEVYNDGVERRGKWDMRATFYVTDGDATPYRVLEYFGFNYGDRFYKRYTVKLIGYIKANNGVQGEITPVYWSNFENAEQARKFAVPKIQSKQWFKFEISPIV